MSSVTSIAPALESSVISMDKASAHMFEDCLEKLTAIVDRTGQPINELSTHPAVRPIMKKMRSLMDQMDSFTPEVEDNADGSLATVTDISSRFGSR